MVSYRDSFTFLPPVVVLVRLYSYLFRKRREEKDSSEVTEEERV
jgi:hypothetical protein